MATLIARLEQMHQYDAPKATIIWEDTTPDRWKNIYNKLHIDDKAIFISNQMIFFCEFDSIIPFKCIRFKNVRNLQISNGDLLNIAAIYPEKTSRIKANFRPFIPDYEINLDEVFKAALNKAFISFYICRKGKESEIFPSLQNGDRIISLNNEKILTDFYLYENGKLEAANFGNEFFLSANQTLNDLLIIQENTSNKDGRQKSINVNAIKNIINTLNKSNFYKFKNFNEYYNIIHNKRQYRNIEDLGFEPIALSKNDNYKIISKNVILYGPPGTGKTFNSINYAVALVEEVHINTIIKEALTNRNAVKKRFDDYVKSGHIAFITFHQSFTYEDFIEGIKPNVEGADKNEMPDINNESAGQIAYKIIPGVFKRIADQARSYKSSILDGNPSSSLTKPLDTADRTFFKMSLGNTQHEDGQDIYNYCTANNCIGLGWGGRNDFYKADTEEKVIAKFDAGGGARSKYEVTAIKCFRLLMRKGDIVLISDGNLLVRAIAQIESDYYYDPEAPIGPNHFRKVTWLLKDARIPVNEIYQKQFSQQTVYMLWDDEIKRDFFTQSNIKKVKIPNHVIIIDEINRGNVSGIFGELITLIEEDKREGRNEAIVATLPYSKESFSVPDNLYIIGTMNTADRSVEALDAALRRRFSFEEMPPRYDLPDLQKEVLGFRLMDILQTINNRLEKLLDKDHRIGHSYFLFQSGIDTQTGLIESLYKNVIPLLQEYFFGDYGKIGLVLGRGFVRKEENGENNLFCEFDYEAVEVLQSKIMYSIIDYRNSSTYPELTFDEALGLLMKS